MYKDARHALDRLRERTTLHDKTVPSLDALVEGVRVPAGRYHLPLHDDAGATAGWAAYKTVGPDGKLVLATILGPEMLPRGSADIRPYLEKSAGMRGPHTYTDRHGKIYDVKKLWELAEGQPSEEVDYSRYAGPTARRLVSGEMGRAHQKRVRNADLSYPILISPDDDRMDGNHRIAKALLEGRKTLPAIRLTREQVERALTKKAAQSEDAERSWLSDYLGHSALNLGQAARDVRYFLNHPHADKIAPEGSPLHVAASVTSRIPSLASNLYYAALPPQLHHTPEELAQDSELSLRELFLRGYAPWKYKTANVMSPEDYMPNINMRKLAARLKRAGESADADGNGEISPKELHEHFDGDHDGKVDMQDYARHINLHMAHPEWLAQETAKLVADNEGVPAKKTAAFAALRRRLQSKVR